MKNMEDKKLESQGLSNTTLVRDLKLKKKPLPEIERSIIKSYRKYLWVKFIKAINDYELVSENDKIAVAISGGKDSLLLSKLFQELQKHSKFDFELEFLVMDPGFNKDVRNLLEENLKYLNIPAKIFDSDIFEVADKIAKGDPCYMCARMRRGFLYAKAKELGCNKLALGHHYDDVVETILLNVLCSGNFKTMMPKLHSSNFEGIELIRPMYYIEEKSIIRFMKNAGIQALDCSCTIAEKKSGNKRFEIKALIEDLEKNFTNVKQSIFKSAENVDSGAIIGWKENGEKKSFLDRY